METIERTAGEFFDRRASHYDEHARLGMPRRDEMMSQLIERLPAGSGRILELGCGTGALTEALVRRFPGADVTATDASAEMIVRARERLRPLRGGTVTFECAAFADQALPEAHFDLITSSMALHHIPDKAPFYARLARALRPGACLVFADELTAALDHVETLHWNRWVEYAQQRGHLTPAEMVDCLAHIARHDHYETLGDQLGMLEDAGLAGVDCVWRYLNYAVFTARRPPVELG